MLDGKNSGFSDNDQQRRNRITKLLSDWGLVEVVDPTRIEVYVHYLKSRLFHTERNLNGN